MISSEPTKRSCSVDIRTRAFPSPVTRLSYFARIVPPRRQPCCVILAGPTEIALKVDIIQLRLTCSRGGRRRRVPPRRPSTAAAPAVAAEDTPDAAAAPVESHIGRLGKSRVRSLVVRYLLLLPRGLRRGGLEQWRLMTIRRLLRR